MIRVRAGLALLTISAGTLLSGCAHQADPAAVIAADRMARQTDSLRNALASADTSALHHMRALFAAEREGIELRFRDTLSVKEAEVLGNYHRAMAVTLPQLMKARREQLALLDSTAIRLDHLRHDLHEGVLDRHEVQRAIHVESDWNTHLKQASQRIARNTEQLIRDRRAYRSAIDSLLHR